MGNILAIFALLLVLGIAIWGAMTAWNYMPRILEIVSSPFSSTPTLTVTSSTGPLASGAQSTLAWDYSKNVSDGYFAFTYACSDKTSVSAPVAAGETYGVITCGTPYGIAATEQSFPIIPKNESGATANVPFTLQYVGADGTFGASTTKAFTILAASGNSTENSNAPVTSGTSGGAQTKGGTTGTKTTPVTKKTSGTYSSTYTQPKPLGPADLLVRIVSIDTTPGSSQSTVRFEVKNVGGHATGQWSFTADLPTYPSAYRYYSPTQASLNPQDGVVFTLNFDQSVGGTLSISVDPYNDVYEANEGNNYASQAISGGSYPQYQPYYTY